MTPPGKITAGDDACTDTANVFKPRTTADTGAGVPEGSWVGTRAAVCKGIVVVDDPPRTTSAPPADCSDKIWEEIVMTLPGLRVISPGSTTAGEDVWIDTAIVCEASTTADTSAGFPVGSCVGA